MILSDKTIRKLINEGKLIENPIDLEESLQPSSYDLTLSDQFLIPASNTGGSNIIDLRKELEYTTLPLRTTPNGDTYVIIPSKQFVLAVTQEILNIPEDVTAFVEGRSSIGRSGLIIEDAGLVDAGYTGKITLELYNMTNYDIKLYVGMRIGQLVFYMNDYPSDNPYNGKYQGDLEIAGSRIHKDFE